MTVCVFDPYNGRCYTDSVTMRGNLYSNGVCKLFQLEHKKRIYTIMCSGVCRATTFARDVVMRHIIEGEIDAGSELERFTSAVGPVNENPFTITVVEYDTEDKSVRCFSYDNIFVPYEVQWFDNEIVVNADPEIELALQAMYKFVHTSDVIGPATPNDVINMLMTLRDCHAYVSSRDMPNKVDITEVDPEFLYDYYKRRTFAEY